MAGDPIAILWAVFTRSGNFAPIDPKGERVTLFRDEYAARKQFIPGDRISRVYVCEDDPRVNAKTT